MIGFAALIDFIRRYRTLHNPPTTEPESSFGPFPIRFGILGASRIAPDALITPAKSHPDVVVSAIAARDELKALAFKRKHNIESLYCGRNPYERLLDNPDVDAVYISLPNGLHFEWAMRALEMGKHVLLEKPSTDTAENTKKLFEFAEQRNLVLMEAFHYRFHPAIQRVKEIIESGEIGAIKSIDAKMSIPASIFLKPDDIRFKYELGGGSIMDLGCYGIHAMRYLTGSDPLEVTSATVDLVPGTTNVDRGATASLVFPGVIGSMDLHLYRPWKWGIIPSLPQFPLKVTGEKGEVELTFFLLPHMLHSITVSVQDEKAPKGVKVRTEQAFKPKDENMKGEDWWSTYRYQLEAFVDKLKGRTPQTWITPEDSIANMEAIEMVYKKNGLGPRPKSEFMLPPHFPRGSDAVLNTL
ncbi:NAD(P)-binding protein [Abortiporus biennis]|nr:NAD(P)-binding protein [Abortiporus biennis]